MLLPLIAMISVMSQPATLPPLKHPVAIIAHRAGRGLAPENTLAAIRNAIALGVDYVELDIRASRDGKLVIMHDSTVDRTTNGKGAVKDLTLEELRKLDAGSKFSPRYAGERIPTFDEVLALCRGHVNIYVDHKEAPTAQVLKAIREHGMEKQVIIYNGTEELKEWKQLAPELPIMPSLPDEYRNAGGPARYRAILPAEVLDGNLVEWTEPLLNEAHAAGAKVYVDNLGPNDNAAGFRKAIKMGIDGIQTDYPDRLLQAVRAENLAGDQAARHGRAFRAVDHFEDFAREEQDAGKIVSLTSPEWPLDLPAKEFVLSWNADTPGNSWLSLELRVKRGEHWSKYYAMGDWSRDRTHRISTDGQKDADGDVHTDTLDLIHPGEKAQVRVTLHGEAAGQPSLKFLGLSQLDPAAANLPLEPNRRAWGHELAVPGKTQLGWPDGSGWCSPTSTAMTLAYWAKERSRPEMDLPVPDAAGAIFDRVYKGTGNWPFNTAFAGSFPGIRAYVTRLCDIRQLEDWTLVGIPPVVSVSYDLLLGKTRDNDPGHLMVCIGFAENGDIVLNDPAHHPERGEVARRIFSRERFLHAWNRSHNTVYLIYPEDAPVPADPFGHWAAPK